MRITIHATIEDASSAPQLVQIGEVTRDAGVDPASGLGLFVREANALLRQIQSVVLNEQADEFIRVAAACQACGTRFTGIKQPGEFRIVTRSHVIAWRDDLVQRALSSMTIRHRLAALSSLFEHLCESNAVTHNPVKGVKRPPVESYEGKTPALGDHQARALLEAPDGVSLKGKRDRAILATLLYHALRREELCKLTVKDFRHERRGVLHLKVSGKGSKTRYVPLHPATSGLILDYLEADGRALETTGALFRAVGNRAGGLAKAITADAIYKTVRGYSAKLGFEIGAHALRATAATNALDHQADIAKVQEWLGHANIATTRIYDHRKTRAEDSPTFKVAY